MNRIRFASALALMVVFMSFLAMVLYILLSVLGIIVVDATSGWQMLGIFAGLNSLAIFIYFFMERMYLYQAIITSEKSPLEYITSPLKGQTQLSERG